MVQCCWEFLVNQALSSIYLNSGVNSSFSFLILSFNVAIVGLDLHSQFMYWIFSPSLSHSLTLSFWRLNVVSLCRNDTTTKLQYNTINYDEQQILLPISPIKASFESLKRKKKKKINKTTGADRRDYGILWNWFNSSTERERALWVSAPWKSFGF